MISNKKVSGYSETVTLSKCEFCGLENVIVKEYDLGDGDKAVGCVDEERCKRQMMYNEWGEDV